jgi:hypothetical protein
LELLIPYIIQKSNEISKNPNYVLYSLFALYRYFNLSKINQNLFKEFLNVGINLNNIEVYETNFNIYYPVYKFYFENFSKFKMYEDGKKFFLQLLTKFPNKLKFHPFQSYILFFSYLSKNYEKIDDLLNQFIIITEHKDYSIALDFSMFAFYKGEILLNKEKFIHASLSFGYNVINIQKNKENYIDLFQIESIKRICLLIQILPNEFSDVFNKILERFKTLKGFKELNPYLTLTKNQFENFILINKENLKKSNILGFSNVVLKEIRFKQIQNILRKYKRIKLSKLTSLCGIDYPTVKYILEYYVSKNKINVKFDEIDDIIEVFEAETKCSLEEIQEYYKYLNQISIELYNYDKLKIKEIKKINQLSEHEKLKYLKNREDRLNDEDDEDDD